jgi:hypothetical protein
MSSLGIANSHSFLLFAGISLSLAGLIAWRKYAYARKRIKKSKRGNVNIGGNELK